MELNREQINEAIKTIEGARVMVANRDFNKFQMAVITAINALSLINELTVELDAMRGAANSYKMHNEKLTEENEKLKASTIDYRNIPYIVAEAKADTVRKMQSEIKERCIKGGIYPAFVEGTIDQIAKEMLEEIK